MVLVLACWLVVGAFVEIVKMKWFSGTETETSWTIGLFPILLPSSKLHTEFVGYVA